MGMNVSMMWCKIVAKLIKMGMNQRCDAMRCKIVAGYIMMSMLIVYYARVYLDN